METRDIVIDCLNAGKSAYIDGVLPGGGVGLIHAFDLIPKTELEFTSFDQKVAFDILRDSIREPFKCILGNYGINGATILDKVLGRGDPWVGYDARLGIFIYIYIYIYRRSKEYAGGRSIRSIGCGEECIRECTQCGIYYTYH